MRLVFGFLLYAFAALAPATAQEFIGGVFRGMSEAELREVHPNVKEIDISVPGLTRLDDEQSSMFGFNATLGYFFFEGGLVRVLATWQAGRGEVARSGSATLERVITERLGKPWYSEPVREGNELRWLFSEVEFRYQPPLLGRAMLSMQRYSDIDPMPASLAARFDTTLLTISQVNDLTPAEQATQLALSTQAITAHFTQDVNDQDSTACVQELATENPGKTSFTSLAYDVVDKGLRTNAGLQPFANALYGEVRRLCLRNPALDSLKQATQARADELKAKIAAQQARMERLTSHLPELADGRKVTQIERGGQRIFVFASDNQTPVPTDLLSGIRPASNPIPLQPGDIEK